MDVAGDITVLKHQHPGFALLDQAQAEGFAQSVTRSQQRSIALATQQIAQGVTSQIVSIFKRLDQPLLLAFIQRRRLQEILQPLKRFAVIAEALLPANVFCH
jgi:hypothetical protein